MLIKEILHTFLDSFTDLRYFPLNEHRDTIYLVKT